MNRNLHLIKSICLAITLVFVISSIAVAGAVIRRGGDRDKADDKKDSKTTVSRSAEPSKKGSSQSSSSATVRDSRRDQPSQPATPRVNGRSQPSQPTTPRVNGRSQPSQPTTPRVNGRSQPSQPAEPRDSGRSQSSRRIEPARPTQPAQPSQPARSTYRSPEPDRSSSSHAVIDRGGPDASPSRRISNSNDRNRVQDTRSRDTRSSVYRLHRERPNDQKFVRIEERESYRSHDRSGWDHHPEFRGGYYYYGYGWPHYYDYPLTYAHWGFEFESDFSLRSAYFYYDYFPYVSRARVIIINRPVVTYVEVPIVIREKSYGGSYYLEDRGYASVDYALADIRNAWILREPDLLLRYIGSDSKIDVMLDGDYAYSVGADDYVGMTQDAIVSTETTDFEFEAVYSRGHDKVVAYGKHKFYNLNDENKTVYISYELERRGGEWIITQVGSSPKRFGY